MAIFFLTIFANKKQTMNIVGVIPARYASTRFPGKPLIDINGKPMIQHVYEQAQKALRHVCVATDDTKIFDCVKSFGGQVVLTNENHQSGTDRCAEAIEKFETDNNTTADVVINIQGDEPFISPEQIALLADLFKQKEVQIATLIKPISEKETLFNSNKVKVTINKNNEALYFSRSPIPFVRNSNESEWIHKTNFYHHIGMYGYTKKVLHDICLLETGLLEEAESLEQLRWLENGYKIKTAITQIEGVSIDTPEDLENLLKTL